MNPRLTRGRTYSTSIKCGSIRPTSAMNSSRPILPKHKRLHSQITSSVVASYNDPPRQTSGLISRYDSTRCSQQPQPNQPLSLQRSQESLRSGRPQSQRKYKQNKHLNTSYSGFWEVKAPHVNNKIYLVPEKVELQVPAIQVTNNIQFMSAGHQSNLNYSYMSGTSPNRSMNAINEFDQVNPQIQRLFESIFVSKKKINASKVEIE